jgi:hypothetical protein
LTAEELMDQFREQMPKASNQVIPDPDEDADKNRQNLTDQPKPPSQEEIAQLITKQLQEQRERDSHLSNADQVKQELEKVWGKDFSYKLNVRAQELNLGQEFLASLAATSPNAFLTLVLGEQRDKKDDIFTPPSGGSNPPPGEDNTRNFKYYQKIRREDSKRYRLPSFQAEMHEAAARMGKAFYD